MRIGQILQAALLRTPFLDSAGMVSRPWSTWLNDISLSVSTVDTRTQLAALTARVDAMEQYLISLGYTPPA